MCFTLMEKCFPSKGTISQDNAFPTSQLIIHFICFCSQMINRFLINYAWGETIGADHANSNIPILAMRLRMSKTGSLYSTLQHATQ